GVSSRVALVAGVTEPGAGLALRLGDLARGHLVGDFGAAGLAAGVARQRCEVEPFVGFNEVDRDPAPARRICDAELVKCLNASGLGFRHAGAEEEIGTLLTDRTHKTSPVPCLRRNSRRRDEQMVNAAMTLKFRLCPK